jgi:hypothetical protein
MAEIYFFGLITAVVLIAGCADTQTKSTTPEGVMKSMLSESWTLSAEEEVVPALLKGSAECKLVKLRNPSEKYFDPNGGFNYTAWHDFWFCPKDWVGEAPNIPPMVQQYPAELLCDCKEYRIYHLSLGGNSQRDLPEKVKNEFSK